MDWRPSADTINVRRLHPIGLCSVCIALGALTSALPALPGAFLWLIALVGGLASALHIPWRARLYFGCALVVLASPFWSIQGAVVFAAGLGLMTMSGAQLVQHQVGSRVG
jgi:hypothetical protein